MKKLFSAFALMSSLCLLFAVSCNNKPRKKNSSIFLESNSGNYSEQTGNITELNLRNDYFTELKHKESQKQLNLEKYELKNLDSSFNGTLVSVNCIKDKLIINSYPADEQNCIETGIFNPYNNTYEKTGRTPFCAAYGNNTGVLAERYFFMIDADEADGELNGKVTICDIKNNSSWTIDNYKIHNIVQYITAVSEKGIAYCYYENETQDWVIKYHDIVTDETKEIFRHTNFNDVPLSPVALASDGKDIVLAIQSSGEEAYKTQLIWIDPDNSDHKTEKVNLERFFGDEAFEITDFIINNNYYCFKASVENEEEYFIFDRSDDILHVTLAAITRLNDLEGSFDSSSDILFRQNEPVLGDLIDINLTDGSFVSYSLPVEFTEQNNISFLKTNSKGDMIIFYGTEPSGCKYQIIRDYRSDAAVQTDAALYASPEDNYSNYVNSDHATKDGIEEMKRSMENIKKSMAENDFRWEFVYQYND